MSAALQRIGRVSLAAALAAALHGAALYCASQVSENIRYNRDPTSYQVWTILALGVGALFLIGVVTQSYSAWREDRHIAGLGVIVLIILAWARLAYVAVERGDFWLGAKWGAVAGAALGLLSLGGGRDRYQRTVTYDRATGRVLSASDWLFTGRSESAGGCGLLLWTAIMGALLGPAYWGGFQAYGLQHLRLW